MDKVKRCGSDQCVEVAPTATGFVFTSSIEGNDGAVEYTPDEVRQFLEDVKAGHWDSLHAEAMNRAELAAA